MIQPLPDPYANYPWTTKAEAEKVVARLEAAGKVDASVAQSYDRTRWGVRLWITPTLLKVLLP